ncbi:alpha hydrolase [Halobacteriales archaeon SW_5_70_135]|nr:MAG: alpha hydrolase [Halobacteriales archaeon SW_5_70_135]
MPRRSGDAPTVAVLFSGGRDSALAALLLAPAYDVTLVTGSAGLTDDWTYARDAARALAADARAVRPTERGTVGDFDPDFRRVDLDGDVFETAARRVVADGHPRAAVQRLHEHALERVAARAFDAVADGTRVRAMADRRLRVERGPSETVGRADYEGELRALVREGGGSVTDLFPEHEQSRVTGLRAGGDEGESGDDDGKS